MPCSATYDFTSATTLVPTLEEMPRNLTPLEAYSVLRAMRSGISCLHGPHQVAQKLTRLTLPLNEAKSICLPVESVQEKLGALSGRSWTLETSDTPAADEEPAVAAAEVSAAFFLQPGTARMAARRIRTTIACFMELGLSYNLLKDSENRGCFKSNGK